MSEQYSAPDTTTNEWDSYPFSIDGVNFQSKIRKGSEMAMRLLFVPNEVFIQMNKDSVRECVGNVLTMSRSEILNKLEQVNHGGTNAILELA